MSGPCLLTGVEPVSRGLPTTGPLKYYPNGAARDRQWELMKRNMQGKWQRTALWYEKEALDHSTFIANLRSDRLSPPSLSVPAFISWMPICHGKWSKFAPGEVNKFWTLVERLVMNLENILCLKGLLVNVLLQGS